MMAIFSPLVTSVEKPSHTVTSGQRFVRWSSVSVCFPDGFFTKNWMNGSLVFRFLRGGGRTLLDLLLAALPLGGALPGGDPRHEVWELIDLLRALGFSLLDAPAVLALAHPHPVVPAGVSDDRLVV